MFSSAWQAENLQGQADRRHMAHNEIRVNKSRDDKAVDNLVKSLDDLGGCKFLFPPEALSKGFRELIAAEQKDFAEARQEQGLPLNYTLDSDEQKLFEERLTQCAWQHFNEQSSEKLRVTLAELIHESLGFAESIYCERLGASEEQINEARPSLADLQQNVLRRSILHLRKLPYRRSSEDADENNEALFPLTRACAEIFNHLAFWTYDHVRVAHLFKDTFFPIVKDHSEPNKEATFFANEAAEFVWDNIDGGIQTMINILVAFAMKLAKASAIQRHRHLVPQTEVKKFEFSSSDLEGVVKVLLRPWFEILSVKLEKKAGRKPKEQPVSEITKFEDQVIEKMLEILDEPEAITQYRVARKLNLGDPRNKKDRTLYNKLHQLALDWKLLKERAKRIYRERQSAQ